MKSIIFATMATLARAGHDGGETAPPPVVEEGGWFFQAKENDMAKCYGLVRYGNKKGAWSKVLKIEGEYKCSNANFGDPWPGMYKTCECKEQKEDSDGNESDSDEEDNNVDEDDQPFDQAVEMDTPIGEMSVEWDDGYYEGAVYLDDEEYAYNFRRTNAVGLGVSTIAMLSAAIMA